jgi:S1-C subfamily serine protease
MVLASEDGTQVGATFITQDGYAITCAHGGEKGLKVYVLREVPGATVVTEIVKSYPAEAVYVWTEADLMIVRVDLPAKVRIPVVEIAIEPPQIGDFIMTWGHPLSWYWLPGYGRILDFRYQDNGIRMILHDISGNAGNSGGPLLNARGELIGIDVSMLEAIPTMWGYIPLLTGGAGTSITEYREAIFAIVGVDRRLRHVRQEFAEAEKYAEAVE